MSSTSPERPAEFALRLSAETGAELFVVDSSLRLVQRGVGSLDARLPSGVYKVKVRRGREEIEQVILLDHDEAITLRPPSIASPAPFEDTARTHEWHIAAAEQESARIHVQAGTGAQVFLMSRYWTSPTRRPEGQREHPARGLTLRTMSGRVVVDYERDAVLTEGADPLAACTVALAPGTYFLHRRTGERHAIEQAVVASPNWQTQVFILKDPVLGVPEPVGGDRDLAQQRALRPDAMSVLMSRGGFDSRRADMELAEVAQLALADERRILSDQMSQMLDGKFENPMLGIFGAHLLLLSLSRATDEALARKPDRVQMALPAEAGYLDVIVNNLRSLVGPDHPDVEALSIRCLDRRLHTRQPLAAPPMLRRSWSLFVEASNERRDICPRSIWTRVRKFIFAPPFLTWARTGSAETDPAVAMARSLATRQVRSQADRRRTRAATPRTRTDTARGVLRGRLELPMALAPGLERLIPTDDGGAPPERRIQTPVRRRGPDLRQMSIDNDIPRGEIDKAFGRR